MIRVVFVVRTECIVIVSQKEKKKQLNRAIKQQDKSVNEKREQSQPRSIPENRTCFDERVTHVCIKINMRYRDTLQFKCQ